MGHFKIYKLLFHDRGEQKTNKYLFMGKRKTVKRKVKAKEPLKSGEFDCPLCNNRGCVAAKIDRRLGRAQAFCRICTRSYNADRITPYTEPMDVFIEWVDSVNDNDPDEEVPNEIDGYDEDHQLQLDYYNNDEVDEGEELDDQFDDEFDEI